MATVLGSNEGSLSIDEKARRDGAWNLRIRSFTITYTVLSDNLDENWLAIEYMADLPHIGDRKYGCTCKSYKLKETNTVFIDGKPRFKWEIEYSYDSECAATDISGKKPEEPDPQDPLNWPVEISWSGSTVKKVIYKSVSNNPQAITNSVGQLLPQEIEQGVECLTISRYEPYVWGPSWIKKYYHKLNSDEFLDYNPYQCFIEDVSATRELINGGYYFKVTYKILFDDSEECPWDFSILDHGTKAKDPRHGNQIRDICEIHGTATTVNLNGNGFELAENSPPVFITYGKYKTVSFADLKLWLTESKIPKSKD